ncbi:MAG TPA: putative Ig domain-containing protein [Thermoanaerobaculia bacterium]|nr:putative Ig domain-containing protein [Thermoanaerobaculia bacterium]
MRKTILLAMALVSLFFAASAFAQCETLIILNEFVPEFQVNQPVHFQFDVIGGTPPYKFSIYDGALPDGLKLLSNGKIVGKPTQVTDTTVFFQLTDGAGCGFVQAYAIRVSDLSQ